LVPIQVSDSTYGPPTNPDPSWPTWGTSLQGNSYSNLGIAGITLDNTVALNPTEAIINSTICANNPYGRFMNFGNFATPKLYIDNLRTCGATFFTCWLGSNDVLGYASAGGVPTVVSTFLGNITLNAITSPSIFAQKYDSILTVFHKIGAKGVCATIPDVTSIPFFNTVPSYITVNGNQQFLYIRTAAGVRQATIQDHILLTAYDSVLAGQGLTASNPLSNPLVLDASEVDSVEIALTQYNSSIKSLAASFGFPVVDMYKYLGSLQQSIYVDGITFNRTFIQGGAIGLDGVHPNARGYALVANQFIQVINASFGATIPPANVTQYRGVLFP
ncbi:MAG TPA: SGNH/GDSL hydrolase family protein, partial [Bacteroidia bacterium]|nr:SGNH/GDSL hydrolase family protein [Bacteroidia bacterium]